MSDIDELQSVLERVSQREAAAQKRAVIYTAIPIIVAILLIWVTWRQVSQATTELDQAKAELSNTEQQLDESNRQLAEAQTLTTALEKQLTQTKDELDILGPQLLELQEKAKTLELQVQQSQQEITNLQAQRDNLSEQVEFLTIQVQESRIFENKLFEGDMFVIVKNLFAYDGQRSLLETILSLQTESSWEAGGLGPSGFDSPGFAAYVLKEHGLLAADPEDVHYSLMDQLEPNNTGTPQLGDVIFYESGYAMFYFQDPETGEDFVIGMTTFGVIPLEYDFAPIRFIRHVNYP